MLCGDCEPKALHPCRSGNAAIHLMGILRCLQWACLDLVELQLQMKDLVAYSADCAGWVIASSPVFQRLAR